MKGRKNQLVRGFICWQSMSTAVALIAGAFYGGIG